MFIGIKLFTLCESTYNNRNHLIIEMTLFEALYARKCRSPIGWFDAFKVKRWSKRSIEGASRDSEIH